MHKEGLAIIEHDSAFFNPSARFSRDLSVAIARRSNSRYVLDPTAATGIRGIRYELEADAERIVMLEINSSAYKELVANMQRNGVKKGIAMNKSIQEFANTTREKFDIIDLDPFGSPAFYIYDLLKVSKNGTLIMATATDTAVLCGAHPSACIRIYDSMPIHTNICHEVGVRILMGFIARNSVEFNYGIAPKLVFSYKHYMRVILELRHGVKMVKETLSNTGYLYQCRSCDYIGSSRGHVPDMSLCPVCGNKLSIGGKLWIGRLYDKELIKGIGEELDHIEGSNEAIKLLDNIYNEVDTPGYFSIPLLTKHMHIGAVSPFKVIDCLKEKGFIASPTHFEKSSIKTDAGIEEIKDCISKLKR